MITPWPEERSGRNEPYHKTHLTLNSKALHQMVNDRSKTTFDTCSRCQSPATHRCVGCEEAPIYDKGISEPMYYCSPECQEADWGQHKLHCKKLQLRKILGRAAVLLPATIGRIRLHAWPEKYRSVRIEDLMIVLDSFQRAGLDVEQALEASTIDNPGLLEPVLVYLGCSEAMIYLCGFAKAFFTGKLCSMVDEVDISMSEQQLRIPIRIPNKASFTPPASSSHNVYKATLKNRECTRDLHTPNDAPRM
ncbi:hypothetical protein B7494_g924 [Chlorociboria aeruginascens]|nr:hypothetical protein B7494_g924 [Chlorociboria aeruginascens]